MKKQPQVMTCRKCKWARWELTAKGNIRRGRPGTCTKRTPGPHILKGRLKLPIACDVTLEVKKGLISYTAEHKCPQYDEG